jgi:hypothetical protein
VTDALFETENLASLTPRAREKPEKLSADRRRTARQRELITRGHHPLAYLGAARHPDTRGLAYERTDPTGRDLTCGSCRFRRLQFGGARDYPKCIVPGDGSPMTRATSGASSDVRAWWPACTLWAARDA